MRPYGVDERVDEDRAQVLDDEHRPPGNLWAEVFYIDDALVAQACRIKGDVAGIRDWSAITALCHPQLMDRKL